MKALKVTQVGKVNSTFIVKDQKKIEFWKMMAAKVSGNVGMTITNVEEIEMEDHNEKRPSKKNSIKENKRHPYKNRRPSQSKQRDSKK